MCLTISKESKVRIATEDIVCYKILIGVKSYLIDEKDDGAKFVGTIAGIECSGQIHISKCGVETPHYKIYFFTNDERLNGAGADEIQNQPYKYSWVLDMAVQEIIVNGKKLIFTEETGNFLTYYREASVKIGNTYISDLIVDEDGVSIHKGLHSFVNMPDIKDFIKGTCVQCVIPKGSKYYIGRFDGEKLSYAADTLKYVKVIPFTYEDMDETAKHRD